MELELVGVMSSSQLLKRGERGLGMLTGWGICAARLCLRQRLEGAGVYAYPRPADKAGMSTVSFMPVLLIL